MAVAAARLLAVLLVFGVLGSTLGQQSCFECPGIWSPVCGRDGYATSAFSSLCQMYRFNCINKTRFYRTVDSECPALALRSSLNAIPQY